MQRGNSTLISIEEERRREANWRSQTADVIRTATERYLQIAAALKLDAKATEALVSAAVCGGFQSTFLKPGGKWPCVSW